MKRWMVPASAVPLQPLHRRPHTARKWRNRQTHQVENPVVAKPWGFKFPPSAPTPANKTEPHR